MLTRRSRGLRRLALTLSIVLSILNDSSASVGASGPATAPSGRPARTHLSPPAGPPLLRAVPANAFPVRHGFGDARFGIVEAFERPANADDLHVGWERVQVRWDQLQPKGPLQWDSNATENDVPFNRELAHGRELVGVIQGIPGWAAANRGSGSGAVPRNINLPWSDSRNYWGQFVYRAVRHYVGRIDTFAILNEVNIASGNYHQFSGTVSQYAQMLRVAYLAAHAANPHVEIHAYGDSVYADLGAWFTKMVTILSHFPGARANNDFYDAAEVHLYASVMQWDRLIASWHATMHMHGGDHPIWMSETNVAPRDDRVAPAHPANHNTPLAIQPYFIVDSFAAGLGLGMPREEVYRMLDPRHIYPEHPSGLVRRDGTVRPEYTAFKTVNTWFAGVFASRYDACSTNFVDKHCLFRVTMERPGQEVQVFWNQGGLPLDARVAAMSATAKVVLPNGTASTIHAQAGGFTLHLAAATDRALDNPKAFKIGSMPLIVVQNLPPGRHVPGLHTIFVERDRSAGAGTNLGPVTAMATVPDSSGRRAIADPTHDRVLIENARGSIVAYIGGTGGYPGQFRGPTGLAIGPDGTLYVADQGNARIQEFDLQGRLLGGFGSYVAGAASLHAPTSVAVAPDGTIFVVDAAQDAVLHFSRFGVFMGRFGGPGNGIAQFDGPGGIAIDAKGMLYVADTLNNRVEQFDLLGHFVGQIGSGTAGSGRSNLHWPVGVTPLAGAVAVADADNARLIITTSERVYLGTIALHGVVQPGGLAVAPDGSYFVTDAALNRVVHFNAGGQSISSFGGRGFGRGQFLNPLGLDVGADADVYVADAGNNRVEVLTPNGAFVRFFGHYGSTPGRFIGPRAISVDVDGTVWVASDTRVQHLTGDGRLLGPAITGVNSAWGVAADHHGGVYYTARYGQRVYHLNASALTTGVWGGPGSGAGEFQHPAAMAVSADGTVYVVDEGNARVQFLSGGAIVGQRGSAGTGASGLVDPVAVATAGDRSIAILDAALRRIVRFAGASGDAFSAVATHGIPLGLAVGPSGQLDTSVCDPLTGASTRASIPAR